MPIHMDVATRRLDQATFGKIAHDVMRCVFDIHNEFGRFFDEKIYKRELSRRFPNTQLEVPMKLDFDNSLYEEALTHLLGGEERVMQEIEIVSGGASLGTQKFRMAGPNVAFKITSFASASDLLEVHARRLLDHSSLQAVQWVNIARHEVLFRTINK